MTDEEMIQRGYPPNLYPWLYPDLFPNYEAPDSAADSEPDSAALATPPAESSVPPVAVVSVEDVLDLIQASKEADPLEEQPAEEAPADPGDTLAVELAPGDLAVVDAVKGVKNELVQISGQLADIQLSSDRPLLTTVFSDYTVTEGLLLLLLLSAFLSACYKLLRGGFQWLRS